MAIFKGQFGDNGADKYTSSDGAQSDKAYYVLHAGNNEDLVLSSVTQRNGTIWTNYTIPAGGFLPLPVTAFTVSSGTLIAYKENAAS